MAKWDNVRCLLCGHTRPIKSFETGRLSFGKTPPSDFSFIITKEGGGRASGFHSIASISFSEAKNNPKYAQMIEDIKRQCEAVLQELK